MRETWQAADMAQKKAQITPKQFGARLKSACREAGVTGKQLAQLAGVDEPRFSRLISGSKGLETRHLLNVLASAHSLGVSLDYLIAGSGNPIRTIAIVAEDAKLVDDLIDMARRLESVRGGDEGPRQVPRSGTNRK